MPRFAEQSLSAFLDALSSPTPTPGGGTAAAVAGAMGASLLMMIAGLPKTRTQAPQERAALDEARAALQKGRDSMVALADQDADAYDQVIAAYRLPKSTDDEKRARRERVRDAMRAATEAPLATVRTAAEIVVHGRTVAQFSNPNASSDVRVALELLEACAAGAAANVEINLASIDDSKYTKGVAHTLVELSGELTEHLAAARASLNVPPAH